MVDLQGKDKGNISLPAGLQPMEEDTGRTMRVQIQPTIIYMQRAFYDIKIADIQKRQNRLEERNKELSEEIENFKELLVTTDTESAEEIAVLNRQVKATMDEVYNYKNEIEETEKGRIEDKRAHHEKVEYFEQRYKLKKTELVSEFKVLSAKSNAVDEFRNVHVVLQEKLESYNEVMRKEEKEVNAIVEKIRFKLKMDKEILKKEMYDHLLNMATTFQIEASQRLNLPIQRLMRENVVLKNEIVQVSQQILHQKSYSYLKSTTAAYRRNIPKHSAVMKRRIIVTKLQNSLLKTLERRHDAMKAKLSSIVIPDQLMEDRTLLALEHAKKTEGEVATRLSRLEVRLFRERTKIGVAKFLRRKVDCNIKRVVHTLYDIKHIVISALENNSSDTVAMGYTELLSLLREILVNGLSKSLHTANSVESVVPPNKVAEDLTNVPENIEFEMSTESEDKLSTIPEILDVIHIDAEVKDGAKKKISVKSVLEDETEDIFKYIEDDQVFEEIESNEESSDFDT